MSQAQQLRAIEGAARRAEARMRAARALAALPTSATLALGVAAGVLATRKVIPHHFPDDWAQACLIGAGASVLLTLLFAALRRLPPHAGALALDRYHDLRGRLTNALQFASLPESSRSGLMAAAMEDACQSVRHGLSARRAVPIPIPPGLLVTLLVSAAVTGLALLEVHRTPVAGPAVVAAGSDALEMTADDLELFRRQAEELERNDQSPEVEAAIKKFNELIEDIANRRLSRTEAFRRMEELEHELLKGAEADAMALEEALKETAKELHNAELTEPLAKSLEKKDLAQAQKDLKDLAERLRAKGKAKPDKKQLERLRKALDRAAKRKQKALDNINERRAELRQQLLKKKRARDAGAPEEREERLLRKKRRELERLDREAERRERSARRLSRLDRDLAKAAEDLLRELGMSAKDLEQAAEDINRLEQEQLSDKEKEELRRRLQELRELIRQQGQGGKKRMARLRRFGNRARGGKQGLRRRPGQGGQPGGKQPGQGKGGQGEKMLVLGPGGKKIPVPGPGAGQGSEGREQGGGSDQPGGKGIGSESGGDPKGAATDPKMDTVDVRAEGLDTQQGPTNSEVILAAADRGFKGRGYQKVYRKYRTVAEDQIDTEKIPDGYRFYVRRYFQLIRPRD